MSTIKDVARLAGVGTGTISRAINAPASVSAATRAKVEAAIEALDYRPNLTARSLARGRSMLLALVLPDLANPYFPALTRGILEVAETAGYGVLLNHTEERPDAERDLVRSLAGWQVDGILWVPTSPLPPAALPARVPLVLLDRTWPDVQVDRVHTDNRAGMRRVMRQLVEWGHRRILHLGGPEGIDTADDRVRGYLDVMAELAEEPVVSRGPFGMESGWARTWAWLQAKRPFTALTAANDLLAIGAVLALQEAGRRVPADVSVTGYDNLRLAQLFRPSLTTVEQPAYRMGREAAQMLVERLRGYVGPPRSRVLAGELVRRESAGRPLAPVAALGGGA
jgi:LacI family transcriptional regulator